MASAGHVSSLAFVPVRFVGEGSVGPGQDILKSSFLWNDNENLYILTSTLYDITDAAAVLSAPYPTCQYYDLPHNYHTVRIPHVAHRCKRNIRGKRRFTNIRLGVYEIPL